MFYCIADKDDGDENDRKLIEVDLPLNYQLKIELQFIIYPGTAGCGQSPISPSFIYDLS